MLWLPLLIAFVPAALMFVLQGRWALGWIALVWAAFFLIYFQMDFSDDPAFLSFALVFGFFIPVNAIATIARLALMLEGLTYDSGSGYRSYEED
jgi:hypothetical protein